MESVRGKLLVATPAVGDWFHRTVVLMVEHAEEGAFGLVLNRPSDHVVGEAVPALVGVAPEDEPVFLGGPVQPEGVVALGEFDDPESSPKLVLEDVGLVDLENPDAALRRIRLYAGHAGWGPDQLDGELEKEAWMVVDPDPEDPFAAGDLWSEVVRRLGAEYELLARMPQDPSMN